LYRRVEADLVTRYVVKLALPEGWVRGFRTNSMSAFALITSALPPGGDILVGVVSDVVAMPKEGRAEATAAKEPDKPEIPSGLRRGPD
jgi:hypothetical protein